MEKLPSGTVTLLFTDIEGSTKLLERAPIAYRDALESHHRILGGTISANRGHVFETIGDGIYAVFSRAQDAVNAALAAQREVRRTEWGEVGELRVRMALHTGALELWTDHYFGPPLYRLARLLATGHGGQILLSRSTYELVRDCLPADASVRDLGEHRLKDLGRSEQVFQLVAPDLRADFPPLRSLDALPTNLPQQLTSFVGRVGDMAEVKLLLSKSRLATLIGAGGVGKTRLALQVAADLLDDFDDGVWLIELGAVSDQALLPQAAAFALSLQEEPGQPILGTLMSHLRTKQVLLVLDNCEHVIDAAARLAEGLLQSCSGLRILATSREALGIAGEASWPVPPLTVPDISSTLTVESLTQFEAVQLFSDRALAVRPDFAVSNANAQAVAQICHRLDGIPLAIELAAARVSLFGAAEIAERLEDRFRLLTGGRRTALPRHQTLQALIDWSYALLSDAERTLLQRLSVFARGWTFESAEAVCGGDGVGQSDILNDLTRLANKSLVVVDQRSGYTRYRLLQTVRHYAEEKLGESGEAALVRKRHFDFFLKFVEEAESQMRGPAQHAWYERLESEQDNLRAAFAWSQSPASPGATGLRLAAALWSSWEESRYPAEVRRCLESALEKGRNESGALRSKALYAAGLNALSGGRTADARALFEKSLALSRQLGQTSVLCRSLLGQARVCESSGDLRVARPILDDALAVAREAGDVEAQAMTLRWLGNVAITLGRRDEALARWEESVILWREYGDRRKLALALRVMGAAMVPERTVRTDMLATASRWLEESLMLSRHAGDRRGVALALGRIGWVSTHTGDREQGRVLLERSVALSRQLGDRYALARALRLLGLNALFRGDHSRARENFEESRAIWAELDDRGALALALCDLGRAAQSEGDYDAAQSHYQDSLSQARDIGNKWSLGNAWFGLGELARQRAEYDRAETAYIETLALFRELGEPAQIDPLRGLAYVELRRDNALRAGPLFQESLRLARMFAHSPGQVLCLAGLAGVAVTEGRLGPAARLYGATEQLLTLALQIDPWERVLCEQSVDTARERFGSVGVSAEDQELLAAFWAEGRSFTLDRAVAEALETKTTA